MDKKTEYQLEGHVELPQEIVRTWYPDDDVRYTGGFYRLNINHNYGGIWGYLFLMKEVHKPVTINVRRWVRWCGFIPILKTVSTRQKSRWHTVWSFRTDFSNDTDLRFYKFTEDWWNHPSFDNIKKVAINYDNLKLSDELLQNVFSEPVTIVRRLHIEIYGHN